METPCPWGRFVTVDGRVLATDEATVSVLDRGLLRGEGVFETLRTYGGRPFAMRRHLSRMATSAAAAGIRLPDADFLQAAIGDAVAANQYPESRMTVTVTAGPGGPAPEAYGDPPPTTIVIVGKLVLPAGEHPPVTAVTLPWVRHEGAALTGMKPTSYLDHLIGHKWAHAQGADEGLWRNSAGDVTEATGSNFFIVESGVLETPPVEAGLLPGVTRDVMLARAASIGVPNRERPIGVDDALGADECFLTSTTKEAVAVASIDGHAIGTGARPVLDALLREFRQWAAANADP